VGWQAFWDFDTIKNKVWLKNYFTRKASIHEVLQLSDPD
jgi:hypothetical protein